MTTNQSSGGSSSDGDRGRVDSLLLLVRDLGAWLRGTARAVAEWVWHYALLGTISAVVVLGMLEFAGVRVGFVPPELSDPLQTAAIGFLVAGYPAKLTVNYFLDWKYTDVYRVDSLKDPIVAHYYVSPETWENRETLEGHAYSDESGNKYVRSVELTDDGIAITGPHRGEKNDVEIETFERAVKANRGTLRQWASIGQNLYSALPSMVQSIESAYWRVMSDDSLQNTAMHPDVVQSQVVEEVEELTDSIETPDEKDLEELIDQQVQEQTGVDPSNLDASDSTDSEGAGKNGQVRGGER